MICSFEPNPRIARIFRANLVDRPTVHLFETALGNYNGTITFYPSSYSQESSVFPVDHGQLAPINVPVARLDSLMDNMILEPPILFKLDLQGYELEALKGADNFISKCNYILTETNFKATNQDGPIFADLQEHLRGHGFKFLQPIAFLKNEFGEINQMDAFFVREDE